MKKCVKDQMHIDVLLSGLRWIVRMLCSLGIFIIVWFAGYAIIDAWLQLSRPGAMFGGVVTYWIARALSEGIAG